MTSRRRMNCLHVLAVLGQDRHFTVIIPGDVTLPENDLYVSVSLFRGQCDSNLDFPIWQFCVTACTSSHMLYLLYYLI